MAGPYRLSIVYCTGCPDRNCPAASWWNFQLLLYSTMRYVTQGRQEGMFWYSSRPMHCKKELAVFPSPAGMSLIKLFLAGNNLVFSRPERVWSVTSRLGTGKWLTLFYSVPSFTLSHIDSRHLPSQPTSFHQLTHRQIIRVSFNEDLFSLEGGLVVELLKGGCTLLKRKFFSYTSSKVFWHVSCIKCRFSVPSC